ncbi:MULTISPECIES: peptide deformylase [Carboxydothermus]|uniref:Peptide deformylase n=2 Tax=Carboxydothermus TaxID=129957 RepID=DEF_CARHZ|nr:MULTISPECIES: peptide deformylase [Carboxydothermus]Q3AC18.1 RecName: Full=Peptide deformylase; Short=PDF; AltName: Full=Polypeptide deformylase [Carboxydothermus hydrogenoformans Z-2901]ABB15321.1 peptide deformylase [Carboxydothermus hydrogenoformans Z-2901]NYE58253.1 peptide deformylase [Carboxydothermus ferrireducens DSM 11255]
MAVYKVVEIGDPILKEIAKPIKEITPNIIKLLENMADTMYAYNGVGLAAPQIGVSKRAIVVDVGEGLIELINPEIIEVSGEEKDIEGCLSVPGVQGEVVRAKKVTVKGLNRYGEEIVIPAEGLLARAFQHEIDHLNGILFVEKADNIVRKGR